MACVCGCPACPLHQLDLIIKQNYCHFHCFHLAAHHRPAVQFICVFCRCCASTHVRVHCFSLLPHREAAQSGAAAILQPACVRDSIKMEFLLALRSSRFLILLIPAVASFFVQAAVASFTGSAERCIMAPPLPCAALPNGFLDCQAIASYHGQTPTFAATETERTEEHGTSSSSDGFLDCLSIVHGGLFPLGHVPTESDVGQVFNGWRYMGSFMGDKWFEPPPSMGARCQQIKKTRRELEAMLEWRVRRADVKAAPRRRQSPLGFTRPLSQFANLD